MRLNMKMRRMEKNLSQKKLALIIGVHPQSISEYERSVKNPSYENMKKISEALDCSVDELFFRD